MENSLVSYDNLAYLCRALGALCLLQFSLISWWVVRKINKRKGEKFEQASRALKFTLPDRENSFVRDRLKGTLCPQEEKEQPTSTLKDFDLRLEYTRKTISKLKASELTPADRLEVNRISKAVTFYALKNVLSPSEMRSLNDCFARLLKLTAKYAV